MNRIVVASGIFAMIAIGALVVALAIPSAVHPPTSAQSPSTGAQTPGSPGRGPVYVQPPFPRGEPLVKPQELMFDKNDKATGVHWNGWGGLLATATGVGHLWSCVPDCGEGFSSTRRVFITVSGIRVCASGRRQYTVLEWRYVGPPLLGGDAAPPRTNSSSALC
jgi:hypothetical protein